MKIEPAALRAWYSTQQGKAGGYREDRAHRPLGRFMWGTRLHSVRIVYASAALSGKFFDLG